MAVPFSNTDLRIPHGFPALLEGLSREVLRHQPQDIFGFAEKYFEELLKRREETGTEDLAQLCARLNDRYYNNRAYCPADLKSSKHEQTEAAIIIQSKYRQYRARREAESLRRERAATHIQATYRGYTERKQLELTQDYSNTHLSFGRKELDEVSANSVTSSVPVKHVSRVSSNQATYAAALAEPHPDQPPTTNPLLSECATHEGTEDFAQLSFAHRLTGVSDDENKAAAKIQASFRGHLARKQHSSLARLERGELQNNLQATVKLDTLNFSESLESAPGNGQSPGDSVRQQGVTDSEDTQALTQVSMDDHSASPTFHLNSDPAFGSHDALIEED